MCSGRGWELAQQTEARTKATSRFLAEKWRPVLCPETRGWQQSSNLYELDLSSGCGSGEIREAVSGSRS